MEKAIKIAIENGYMDEEWYKKNGSGYWIVFSRKENLLEPLRSVTEYGSHGATQHTGWFYDGDVLLDPLFWQALGRGLNMGYVRIKDEDGFLNPREEWKLTWHRFIDNLAQGGSIDEFFNDLIK